jgi:hypothetical protein
MSGHFATLLRGTAQTLPADHDVYITDWHNARGIGLRHGEFRIVLHLPTRQSPQTSRARRSKASVPFRARTCSCSGSNRLRVTIRFAPLVQRGLYAQARQSLMLAQ